ncbi:TRAP transporter small permease [Bacillus solimangrovi]|uniref:C4-dicarboxylate ABC transporter permease n=1 Tax=Bacillus solimangrovi TaxID=1305675 RepID=A0A1E5LDG0_9BACI|nr:TRAP transporter small permease [Bacillus solimangrovi]OEH92104.1 C4-dicarboxylate ABC transporter permease [Bacillus solimangrovi]
MKVLNTLLNRLEEITVAITLTISVILTFIEVVLRYGFGSSIGFTHELVVYLLIFTGMIGASIGVREKVHLGVDLLVLQFPYSIQKALTLFSLIICTLFCIIITILGIEHIQILSQFGQVSPEMEIPLYIPKLIVPLSFGLMTIRFIQQIIIIIKTPAKLTLHKEGGIE